MNRKVLLVTGVLAAGGGVAAVSAPEFLSSDMFSELRDRAGEQPHRSGRRLAARDDEAGSGQARRHRHGKDSAGRGDRVSLAASEEEDAAPAGRHKRHGKMDRDEDDEGPVAQDDDLGRDSGRDEEAGDERGLKPREWSGRSAGRSRSRDDSMGEEEGVQSGRRGKASDAADRRFRRVDRNGDGVVDAAEYEAHLRQHIASASRRLFKQLDRDGDGKLSKEEFTRIDPELATLEPEDRDGLAGESRREPRMRNRHEVK